MTRFQQGYIYETKFAFFVRFYTIEIVDGTERRVQRSHRLCFKDDTHNSKTCKAVRRLAAEHMVEVNAQVTPLVNRTVANFWDKVYLPFIEENLRNSTVHGYKQVWNQHLKPHFGQMMLRDYKTVTGSVFLTSLAKRLGRHTVQHIRSLASGIFTHALNVGAVESNPWHDVRVLGRTIEPGETQHYTLEEAENVISALRCHLDAQAVVALAFFVGLRPGEIQGLRWEDLTDGWVHVRRAVVRNIVGETKTSGSVASLPVIAPVKTVLALWWEKQGRPTDGWVFPNSKGKPRDLRTTVNKIRPTLEEAGLPWKTLYAGRRGAATILTELTGNAVAAKELLRHRNLAVTTAKYVKAVPAALLEGMRLLEEKAGGHDADE